MARTKEIKVPNFDQLIEPTFKALKNLGGSGTNDEILSEIIKIMHLSNDVIDEPHNGSTSLTELSYRTAWARTYLKKYGAIENSARSVWSIHQDYTHIETVNYETIVKKVRQIVSPRNKPITPKDDNVEEILEETKPWRVHLVEILQNMDPYAFERLTQLILRLSGFEDVVVTKKSGDGGIDGIGKFKLNGIFSFNVAFQCKRYKGQVGAPVVRDFRGSLTNDVEKGVLITTGTFTQAAKEDAKKPGKRQIDLIDGEELIDKIIEHRLGVKPIEAYEIEEDFFNKI